MEIIDPIKFQEEYWPEVVFYPQQEDVIYSVCDNNETVVGAGNMLGKDFVSAFIALWFFLSRHPCRVVTTSVDGTQLEGVLWGEIRRFIQTARHPLPLVVNHLHLRKMIGDEVDGLSYLIGRVSAKGEGMLGHHIAETGDGIPRTLFVADEASGVDSISYERADTWARRKLIIGNPYPCTNFFYDGIKGGDIPSPIEPGKLYRKVFKIRGQDSPNVRYAEAEIKAGKTPSHKILVPGVLPYSTYVERRTHWDKQKQTVGLDAEFYEGEEIKLFPASWIEHGIGLHATGYRQARAMGVDAAEGGDSTCWCIVGNEGLIQLISEKTPDTTVIEERTAELIREYNLDPKNVYFDQGGGGTQHANSLRKFHNLEVRTVFFGTTQPEKDYKKFWKSRVERIQIDENRYAYKNRRAELYHKASLRMNPAYGNFSLVPESEGGQYKELYRQLKVMPKLMDGEGRYYLPPKRPLPNSKQDSIIQMLGCSPDEADAFVLACWGLEKREGKVVLKASR